MTGWQACLGRPVPPLLASRTGPPSDYNMIAIHSPILGVFGLGGPELLIILAVLILLFGAKKLPELAKGLGKSVNEFKKASKEAEEEEKAAETKVASVKPSETVKTHGNN
jgi:sec-independent protein translocase protein TatA